MQVVILGQLDHPNVVKLLGLCQDHHDGILQVYIVQEWCSRNLRTFMRKEPHFQREAKKYRHGYTSSDEIAVQLACT